MQVALGTEKGAVNLSFGNPFPRSTTCALCGARADLAFVAHEIDDDPSPCGSVFVRQLRKNSGVPGGLWVHDACAVAVYFCRSCLEVTAKLNQG
jgi:hypothetical protein